MKKFLALALVVIMVMACATTAFAAETVKGSAWWAEGNEGTAPVALPDGETVTFKIDVAEATDADTYAAFCVEVTDGKGFFTTTSAGDAWGAQAWESGSVVNNRDAANAAKGGSYTVTVSRSGNEITVNYADDATGATMHGDLKLTGIEVSGDTTVYVMAQVGTLTVDLDEEGTEEPEVPETSEPEESVPETTEKKEEDYPKITGNLTVGSFFSNRTGAIPLKDGQGYTFNFWMTSSGSNNWDTFIMAIHGDNYAGADQEVLIVRGDNWGWGGGLSDLVAPDGTGNKLAFESNIDWDKWVSTCKSGVNVTIYLSRLGNTLLYEARIGNEWFVKTTATSGKALPENLYVFFTGENVTLSNITTKAGNPITADTSMPFAFMGLAVVAATAVVVLEKKRRIAA